MANFLKIYVEYSEYSDGTELMYQYKKNYWFHVGLKKVIPIFCNGIPDEQIFLLGYRYCVWYRFCVTIFVVWDAHVWLTLVFCGIIHPTAHSHNPFTNVNWQSTIHKAATSLKESICILEPNFWSFKSGARVGLLFWWMSTLDTTIFFALLYSLTFFLTSI